MLSRIAAFLYGVVCYFMFLGTILYAIGFIGNFAVLGPLTPGRRAVAPGFGDQLRAADAVRRPAQCYGSSMVQGRVDQDSSQDRRAQHLRPVLQLRASVAVLEMAAYGVVIWDVDNTTGQVVLQTLFACGWLLVFSATFLINHFDLFGLRQVWLNLVGRTPASVAFVTPGLYRLVRHPLYLDFCSPSGQRRS